MARTLHCSFCGKSEHEIAKLAAGPARIHICDECVETCRVIMAGEGAAPPRAFDPANWPSERLLALLGSVSSALEAYREHMQAIVDTLRSREVSWAAIGEKLGVSRQSAWERFS